MMLQVVAVIFYYSADCFVTRLGDSKSSSVVTVNRTDIDTTVFCCHRGVVVLAMF